MDEDAVTQWAPDSLWEVAAPLIPATPVRPQGGGRRRVDDRRILAAVLYLTRTGYSWWKLPEDAFGVTRATAHRRFVEWTAAGLWRQLHQAALARAATGADPAWSPEIVDAIADQAAKEEAGRPHRSAARGRKGRSATDTK